MFQPTDFSKSRHLFIQRRHGSVHVLWKLSPDLLDDVGLGLAGHLLLRSEELLQALHLLLHLSTRLVVS